MFRLVLLCFFTLVVSWSLMEGASENGKEISDKDIILSRLAEIEVKLLQGANVDGIISNDSTALTYALILCNSELVELLVKYGANVNLKNKYGVPPIFLACDGTTVKVLKDAGANINYETSSGITPLISALNKRNHFVAMKLIEHGADVNVLSPEGTSPLNILKLRKTDYWGDLEKRLENLILAKGGKDVSIRTNNELMGRRKSDVPHVDCEDVMRGETVISQECELTRGKSTQDDSWEE